MFGQFLPNINEMLQCATILHSDLAGAKSAKLNKAQDDVTTLARAGSSGKGSSGATGLDQPQ
jgi:hypothetical protein